MSDRKYPDIDFVETDTETIESNLIAAVWKIWCSGAGA